MKVYKIKGFVRFQRRERIADKALTEAILAAERGLVDADLGGGLIKQRRSERAVFLFGFAKNERDNVDDDELETLRERGQVFLALSTGQLARLLAEGDVTEVEYDEKSEAKN
jgi:hypothetical protein